MKLRIFLIILSGLLLMSCAAGPSTKQMEKELEGYQLESESNGDVIDVFIYYSHADNNKEFGDVAYRLDNGHEYIGKLFYGEYFHFQTTPGSHKISWRGMGKGAGSYKGDSISMNFEAGKTYIFRQVHATIFNRYASDGLSAITSLNLSKDFVRGKYYLSKTSKSNIDKNCLMKNEVSLTKSNCG